MDEASEIERLQAEINQERQMKEMLDESLKELQLTVEELEKGTDSIEDENNEWKTRYENQVEMNQQLEKQLIFMAQKTDKTRSKLREYQGSRSVRIMTEGENVNHQMIRQLEKEKEVLEAQLRDLEWRLDQEAKAYHKASEERKAYQTELNAARVSLEYVLRKQDQQMTTPRGNHPDEQRMTDTRRGGMKKTPSNKSLPKP